MESMTNCAQIIIKDMILFGYHGVYPEESTRGTQFKLSLIADIDPDLHGFYTDEIGDTVNYEMIVERLQMCVTKRRYNLVERLCQVIAESVLELPNIDAVDITVEMRIEGLTPEPQWIGVRRVVRKD